MKFISLFSGIGGFDIGFEGAGMECAAQVEFDAAARSVLARHYPEVDRSITDVRQANRANLPSADLVCGGFPCQDVSVAGKRAGLAGERSGLWFEFRRILDELKPGWVVIENVPGLLSSNDGRDFAAILHGLVELRYGVCWRVLDAQYFGVAQRRRRVFIVGHLGDGRAAEVLFERDGSAGHPPARRTPGEGVAAPVKASPPNRRNGGSYPSAEDFVVEGFEADAIDVRNSRGQGGVSGTLQAKSTGGYSLNYINPIVVSESFRMSRSDDYRAATVASTVAARDYKSATDLIAFNWNAGHSLAEGNNLSPTLRTGHHNHPAIAYSADVSPTLSKESYSPAKSSSGQMVDFAIANNYGVRRLTPTECERLQGFPDGWTAGQSDSARYKQLGNAVCVNVAAWLGRRIVEATHAR